MGEWEGQGLKEVGRRKDTGAVVVRIDSRYFRPAEVEPCLGIPREARARWTPTTNLEEMVQEMINVDQDEARKEAISSAKGSM